MKPIRVVMLVVCTLTIAACGGGNKKLELGGPCSLNSDCQDGLLCKFGACHKACVKSVDCATGERCVQVDGIAVCLAEPCAPGCPAPLACREVDQTCRNQCITAGDCLGGQTCLEKYCVEKPEMDASAGTPDLATAPDLSQAKPDVAAEASTPLPDAPLAPPDANSVPADASTPDTPTISPDTSPTSGIDAGRACPSSGGPAMVRLPQGYCIDSTEVTRGQYTAWLATHPALPKDTDANCGWKASGSYAPEPSCMSLGDVCASNCDNQPQVCVDWCDASAYCAAVGKRLCGKIGGGTNPFVSGQDTNPEGQWYNACSAGGEFGYTYGSAYDGTACQDLALNLGTTVTVGTLTTCQSPNPSYQGVYDLIGNVAEWEDSCNGDGASALCRVLGGAFNASSSWNCGATGTGYRNKGGDLIGFRCCAP